MDCTPLFFANVPAAAGVPAGGRRAAAAERSVSSFATPLGKPRSWPMLRVLDKASLALGRNMAAWASAGRL